MQTEKKIHKYIQTWSNILNKAPATANQRSNSAELINYQCIRSRFTCCHSFYTHTEKERLFAVFFFFCKLFSSSLFVSLLCRSMVPFVLRSIAVSMCAPITFHVFTILYEECAITSRMRMATKKKHYEQRAELYWFLSAISAVLCTHCGEIVDTVDSYRNESVW